MVQLADHPRRDKVFLEDWNAENQVSFLKYLSRCLYPYVIIHDILDLGTGRGEFITTCSRAGFNAYGIDLRTSLYESDTARFVQADARALPFADESFDMAFDSLFFADLSQLQKLPENEIGLVAAEIHRVLRPNGIVYSLQGGGNLLKNHGFKFFQGNDAEHMYVKSNFLKKPE